MALIRNNAAEKAGFLDFSIPSVSRSGSGADFDQVMQSTGAKETNTKDSYKQAPVQSQTSQKDTISAEKPVEKMTVKEKLAAASAKAQQKLTSAGTEPEEIVEAVEALLAGIKELLTENFQVSEEELSGLMSEMGMTDMDLLNPELVDQLAIRLTGAESAMDLLFQPELLDTLKEVKQEITDMKGETLAQLKLTEPEMKNILEGMQEDPKVKQFFEDPVKHADSREEGEPIQENENRPRVEVVESESAQKEQDTQDNGFHKKENSATGKGESTLKQDMTELVNPVVTQLADAVGEALPEEDAQSVVRQLVERIRVSVNEDTSSFEMQLNPEHLGKINLQVAAKNGVVTAQIATENAAVKEALESQLITLKETLNNQGIKIEAVEVTVASHGFERNLDDQRENEQNQQGNQKRRFRFDVMQAAEEELTPADAVIREMMLANGNQINTTA